MMIHHCAGGLRDLFAHRPFAPPPLRPAPSPPHPRRRPTSPPNEDVSRPLSFYNLTNRTISQGAHRSLRGGGRGECSRYIRVVALLGGALRCAAPRATRTEWQIVRNNKTAHCRLPKRGFNLLLRNALPVHSLPQSLKSLVNVPTFDNVEQIKREAVNSTTHLVLRIVNVFFVTRNAIF